MQSREFGQRSGQRVTRDSLRELQGVYEDDPDDVEARASRLRRILFFAGAAVVLAGIYYGTKGSGQQLSQFWNRNSAPVIPQAYIAVGVKDVALDQVNNTCRDRGEALGNGSTVRAAAVYISCLAADNPRRFCQATHRTHFLAAVTNYYRLADKNRDRRADPQVAETLKAVARQGTIPRRDILAAGQADLETVLSGVEAKRGC